MVKTIKRMTESNRRNDSIKHDLYRTPTFLVSFLKPFIPAKVETIYEPCSGKNDIVDSPVLEKFKIIKSDLYFGENRKSFSDVEVVNPSISAIITNPPYSSLDEFLGWCEAQKTWTALFLPIIYLSVKKRQRYFKYLTDLIVFTTRMNLKKWMGRENFHFGAVTYCWFILNFGQFSESERFISHLVNIHSRVKSNKTRIKNGNN